MSCYVVSDLTISAIVAAMADCDFEPADLKDEKPFTLGEKYGCIQCYEYQTSQQPGYHDSEIRDVLDYVRDDLAEKVLEKFGEKRVWGLE